MTREEERTKERAQMTVVLECIVQAYDLGYDLDRHITKARDILEGVEASLQRSIGRAQAMTENKKEL